MSLIEESQKFSIMAHRGQFRNDESNRAYSYHSLMVGYVLKSFGYDDAVAAAGNLQGVVEETDYTVDDIARLFGGDVSSLVMTAIKPKGDLPWKEKMKNLIKALSGMSERNLAVICADKLVTLEELKIQFKKQGQADFSESHVGREDQEWFYKSIYEAISNELDAPIVDQLHDAIEDVFYKSTYFDYNRDRLDSMVLGASSYQKDLMRLKSIVSDTKPYIIEFAGTLESKKESLIDLFKEFLNGAHFRVRVVDDEDERLSGHTKSIAQNKASISLVEKNLLIASAIERGLMHEIVGTQNVIIADSTLFEFLVLTRIKIDQGEMTMADFELYISQFLPYLNQLINHVAVCYNSQDLSYLDVEEGYQPMGYSNAMKNFESLISSTTVVDDTKISNKEAALVLAENFLSIMDKEAVLKLKSFLSRK